MRFLYPLGLLGLIGIPILIIIYIIKSKYMEQTISSTYIWRLSEKFLKKRKKVSKFAGIIALILQLLTVTIISLIIAHPVIVNKGAAKDYTFILDGSASMNMVQNNETRFNIAKDKISNMIENSYNGSSFTLIYVSSEPRVVYESLTNVEKAIEMLDSLDETHLANNCVDSIYYAQYYFNNNKSIQTYLVTDKDYTTTNVNLINVSDNVDNFGIVEAQIYTSEMDNTIQYDRKHIRGIVKSYESDQNLTLQLYIDDELFEEKSVMAKKLEDTSYEFILNKNVEYTDIAVKIKDEDALMQDNEFIIYNLEKQHDNTILLVSETGFLIESAINTSGLYNIKRITPENYEEKKYTGYGLYIFDSYTPEVLPNDGTVWTFGIDSSLEGSNFTIQHNMGELEDNAILKLTEGSTTLFKTLTNGIIGSEIVVHKYIKYGVAKTFTTLYEYNGVSMIFAGLNAHGNRQVGFAFSLHDTQFGMSLDFVILVKNLLNYSFPTVLEENQFKTGETLMLNVLPSCDIIEVITPLGNVKHMATSVDISELMLTEAGTYTINMILNSGEVNETTKTFEVFVSLPEDECHSALEVEEFALVGEPETNFADGINENILYLYILLAVIFVADWMVYCYEQYQLR